MWRRVVGLACVAVLASASSNLGFAMPGVGVARAVRQKRKTPKRARGADVALIPGGAFEMGTDAHEIPRLLERFGVRRADIFSAESPRHRVTLAPFLIDRFEVTNARFRKFLDTHPVWRPGNVAARLHNGNHLKHWNGGEYPEGKADHPVVNVSWYAAVSFCRWAGARLPTEAEWEYAARGGLSDKTFPWGDEMPDAKRANYSASGVGDTLAVGSYAPNGYGLYDMAGNVWEYTADEWGAYDASPRTNPVAGGNLFLRGDDYLRVTTRRVLRGGSFGGAPVNLRVAYRDSHPPDGAREFVGFRCARSSPTKKGR
jgi:formylglycine-generating enzyme required for sulfatase activity